jgi:hypothetical protein
MLVVLFAYPVALGLADLTPTKRLAGNNKNINMGMRACNVS